MGPGRADQEWPTKPPRLVPQSDGYADYVDQSWPGSAGQPAGQRAEQRAGQPMGQQQVAGRRLGRGPDGGKAPYAGHRRKERRGRGRGPARGFGLGSGSGSGSGGSGRTARQRSIRSTITILLVIPLLSLIALL